MSIYKLLTIYSKTANTTIETYADDTAVKIKTTNSHKIHNVLVTSEVTNETLHKSKNYNS